MVTTATISADRTCSLASGVSFIKQAWLHYDAHQAPSACSVFDKFSAHGFCALHGPDPPREVCAGSPDQLFVELDNHLRELCQQKALGEGALGSIYVCISQERGVLPRL